MTAITRRTFGATAMAAALVGKARAADKAPTLRFIPSADLSIVDPYASGVYITRDFGYMVFDTLFSLDEHFKPQPQMVDGWTVSDDKLTWNFRLRDGLAFHDGQKVRGADAAASLKRWGVRNDAYGQALLSAANAIEATDENAFRIALKTPFPVLDAIGTLTAPTPFILPERLAKTDPFTQIKEVIGSGPFKFAPSEWEPGHRVVYLKNSAYVPRKDPPSGVAGGKTVKVDRVEWLYIPDAVTALQALTDGEVDEWGNVPNDYVTGLEHNPDIKLVVMPGFVGTIRFNALFPPFDNEKMREAVLSVTNQRDYMAAVAGDPGNWRTCPSIYACPWGEPDPPDGGVLSGPRNYDKAKRLIAAAGYKGERIVLLDAVDIPQLHAEALVTNDMLKRLGFNVDLAPAEWGTVVKRLYSKDPVDKGGWSVFVTSFASFDMINPATNRMLRANGPNGTLPGWPTDPELEKLRGEWFAAPDDAARATLAAAIQARAFVSVPYIPTGQYRAHGAYRTTLSGRIDAPVPVFWNIEKRA